MKIINSTFHIKRVAAIQMCSSHLIDENLLMAQQLIKEAAENRAQLVVLPEMFAIMGLTPNDKVNVKEPFGHGTIQSFLADMARKHNIWICGGTIPIASTNDMRKVRAACLIINNQGVIVARYDKIHLFDVNLSDKEIYEESATTEPGNEIVVVDTPVGRLGLAVCYDIRFPELFRNLFNQGAEIIALPSAFTISTGEAHWEILARATAIQNFSYVVGACQGGIHSSGRKTYGHSLIIDEWGVIIAQKNDVKPGLIYADINLEQLNERRKKIPVQQHQKIFSIK